MPVEDDAPTTQEVAPTAPLLRRARVRRPTDGRRMTEDGEILKEQEWGRPGPPLQSLTEIKHSDEAAVEPAVEPAAEAAIEAAIEPAVEPAVEASRSRRSVAFSAAQPDSNDVPLACTHAGSSSAAASIDHLLAAAGNDDEQPWSLTQERQARLEQRRETLLQLMCALPLSAALAPYAALAKPHAHCPSLRVHCTLCMGAQARGGTAA
eukprot:scaffold34689_cov57-Phaeocystis_antarctica.AAC.9